MLEQGEKHGSDIPKIGIASRFLKGFVYVLSLRDKNISPIVEGNIAEVTGYTADEFINNGMSIEQLVAEEDLTNYIQERSRIIEKTSNESTLEYKLKHNSVGIIHVAEKIIVQYNSKGDVEFLIGYLEDKTVDVLNAVSMR